jgi:glycerol-3-phosphate dehydrogenase
VTSKTLFAGFHILSETAQYVFENVVFVFDILLYWLAKRFPQRMQIMDQNSDTQHNDVMVDLFVIGGGINGCGIARDAAGRGLSVVLAEMKDLGWATSSASTKLFHGGLRYLENFEFRLVREALIERETLLTAMPHISWPMRFVLPYHKGMRFDSTTPLSSVLGAVAPWLKGRRPAWLIRLGLFLYDTMAGRQFLPGTTRVDLTRSKEVTGLKPDFRSAFEYSDCWVDDARLVALNARDAAQKGAQIMTRTEVISATPCKGGWNVETKNTENGSITTTRAKALVNAAGPWVKEVIQGPIAAKTDGQIRLVRGSHIVTRRLFDHDKCFFFQGTDGRIAFAIPYEQDFTLIGTTDVDHPSADVRPELSPEEEQYLIDFVNAYLNQPISSEDVVWRYSGVRPLYDDGAGAASTASRDYTLRVDRSEGAPVLNVFGGKITTYRRLAESAMQELAEVFPDMRPPWTAKAALPGGAFPVDGQTQLRDELKQSFPFLSDTHVARLVRSYGVDSFDLLQGAQALADLGHDFGQTLYEVEVRWLMQHEFARTAEDILWRRSKLGLRFSDAQVAVLENWLADPSPG